MCGGLMLTSSSQSVGLTVILTDHQKTLGVVGRTEICRFLMCLTDHQLIWYLEPILEEALKRALGTLSWRCSAFFKRD